jgi:hypothetical protein
MISNVPVGLPVQASPIVALLLVVLALVLVFAGRRLLKLLAFLAAGSVGFWLGGLLAAQFAGPFALVAGIVGFVVLGLLGVLLVEFAIAIALGYVGYYLVGAFVGPSIVAIAVGIVCFAVALILRNKILSVVSAFLGGALLFEGLVIFGIFPLLAGAVALVVAIVGAWYQTKRPKRQ